MNHAGQAVENRATDDWSGSDRSAGIVLGAAVIAMGLLAGLFYAFDVAVMPGLTGADDRTLVDAMQQMIDAMENPAFFLTFFGAPVLAAVALVQARRSGSTETARWIMVGLGAYAVMLIVSIAVHFPLNDDLVSAGDPARTRDLAPDDYLISPPLPPPPPPPSCNPVTNGSDVAIPDLGTVSSPITVSGCSGNASTSTEVTVNIRHTWRGDLVVDLIAPSGTVYRLLNRVGGGADNVNQTFTLDASSSPANGTWTLRVRDSAAQDVGSIDSWTIDP